METLDFYQTLSVQISFSEKIASVEKKLRWKKSFGGKKASVKK